MKLAKFWAVLALSAAEMTEPLRVKTWPDAKYLEDVSFVKKFRQISDAIPVKDFSKKKGKEMHAVCSIPGSVYEIGGEKGSVMTRENIFAPYRCAPNMRSVNF